MDSGDDYFINDVPENAPLGAALFATAFTHQRCSVESRGPRGAFGKLANAEAPLIGRQGRAGGLVEGWRWL